MVFTRQRSLLVASLFAAIAVTAAASGCADEDPNYGPPGAIRDRMIDFGVDGGGTSTPAPTGEAGANLTARQAFTPLHTSIQGTCTPCHQAGGIGITFFVGASEDESYTTFKTKGYQNLTVAGGFYSKGMHTGPALTAAQKTLTQTWSAKELAGGTTAPTDAGGGG